MTFDAHHAMTRHSLPSHDRRKCDPCRATARRKRQRLALEKWRRP